MAEHIRTRSGPLQPYLVVLLDRSTGGRRWWWCDSLEQAEKTRVEALQEIQARFEVATYRKGEVK